ncbi:MAG TPA: hypothetical protein VH092_00140, partial [Urbifossiella sp.]|nr:hypothetical protein [Urbifossiella sp.]
MFPVVALLALTPAAPVPDGVPERLVTWSAPLGGTSEHALLGASTGVWSPDGKYILTAGWAKPTPGADPRGEIRVW